MVLVLCIGDLHVPFRAGDVPQKFKELLKPGKIHHALCTGNLCTSTMEEYLRTVCPDLHIVAGDFDDPAPPPAAPGGAPPPPPPDTRVFPSLGGFRVGLCHGHQVVPWGDRDALAALQRQLDVDILVTGHTHEFKAVMYEDRLQINPGSATGAYAPRGVAPPPPPPAAGSGGAHEEPRPSFVLMDLDAPRATVYVYQLTPAGAVKVERIEFTKPAAAVAGGGAAGVAGAAAAAAAAAAAPAAAATASAGAT